MSHSNEANDDAQQAEDGDTTGKKVLMEEITKKRKSLESVSKVVMVENKKNMAENWCGSSSE